MNCFEFRRRTLLHPREPDLQLQDHAKSCVPCAAYGQRMDALEEELQQALRVPIPDGLADRMLLGVQLAQGQRSGWLRAAYDRLCELGGQLREHTDAARLGARYAIGVALLVGLAAASLYHFTAREAELARDIIVHVVSEEPEELRMATPADVSAVPGILAASGVHLPPGVRVVHYLGRCSPPNRSGEHFVLETPFGKATLVLLPGERMPFRVTSTDEGLVAVAAPAPVGSITVVANSMAVAGMIADGLLASTPS